MAIPIRAPAFRDDVRRWGIAAAVYARVMPHLQRLLSFQLFVVHARPLDPNAPISVLPPDCRVDVLDAQALLRYAANPALGMSPSFVAEALARGALCFGYLERDALVSYVWIGVRPTATASGLWVEFASNDSYAYKAFTLPSRRGRRLQQHLSNASDRHLTALGYRYNIDYVDTHNLASIAADRAHGNRAIGYAGFLRGCGRIGPFHSPGVAARGFRFFTPPTSKSERRA